MTRRLPVGAEVQLDGSTHFRVWATRGRALDVVLAAPGGRERVVPLMPEGDGYFSGQALAPAGTRYRYRLNGRVLADPASRFQPDGPFGWSEVVDPSRYRWSDASWRGAALEGQVLYELHVGTFTREGTWRAAMERLADLRRTGITTVELMPVADFDGTFGWGYDGVCPYAPTRLYGTPDDFRAFVDRAHQIGLGVVLDVVYNHLGPSGSVHREYAEEYFTRAYENEWGEALNFDGPSSGPVREYFLANAAYWIDEFHIDGLRLDAIQSIHDRSPEHLVTELTRSVRRAAAGRSVIVVAENERQQSGLLRRELGAGALDGVWNDDFHHSAVVAATGRREAYYSDHAGRPQEFISAAKYGYLFQGQRYDWQQQPRGEWIGRISPAAFINYLENHDQVANSSATGLRLHQRVDAGRYRALTALLLLLPSTPMLFQGQEFGSSSPFLYFADHRGELAEAVRQGRAKHVAQFPSVASDESLARLPAPQDRATFERCRLRWEERDAHPEHVRLFEDLLALRRVDAAFRQQTDGIDGAVLAEHAFVLRYVTPVAPDARLLIVNLGPDLVAGSFPEPLLAPVPGMDWRTRWSSEGAAYGGFGAYPVVTAGGWRIPAHSATVLAPVEASDVASPAR